jgi:hypothetical protein
MKKLLTILLTIMLAVTVQGQYMLYRLGNVYYHNGSAYIKMDTTLARLIGLNNYQLKSDTLSKDATRYWSMTQMPFLLIADSIKTDSVKVGTLWISDKTQFGSSYTASKGVYKNGNNFELSEDAQLYKVHWRDANNYFYFEFDTVTRHLDVNLGDGICTNSELIMDAAGSVSISNLHNCSVQTATLVMRKDSLVLIKTGGTGTYYTSLNIDSANIELNVDTTLQTDKSPVSFRQMKNEIDAGKPCGITVHAVADAYLSNSTSFFGLFAMSNTSGASYTWLYPDKETIFSTDQNTYGNVSGVYYVVADDGNGCTDTAAVLVNSIAGIDGIETNQTQVGTTSLIPHIITGADTTNSTPSKKGNIFVDNSGNIYISKNTSRGGWVKLMYFLPFCFYLGCRRLKYDYKLKI